MTPLDQVRMLPKECPRDDYHESLVQGLVSGELTPQSIAPGFEIPGLGFHRALYTLTMFLAEYRLCGRQAFVVPPGMQEALSRTSLKDVYFDDLKLPYPCIYVAMPDCGAEVWGGEDTQWHTVGGAFLRHISQGEYVKSLDDQEAVITNGMINVYLWGMENERSRAPGDDASMWFTFDLAKLEGMDLESYLSMMLADPQRDASADDVTALGRKLGIFTTFPKDGEMGRRALNGVMHAMRVVFNAVLYMDCEDADVILDPAVAEAQDQRKEIQDALGRLKNPNKSRGRRLRKRLDNLPLDTVSWVGRSVAVTAFPTDANGDGDPGTPQRLHWVRGHWWPRRDTIQKRITEATEAATEAADLLATAMARMANASAQEVPEALPVLAGFKRLSSTKDHDLNRLIDSLNAKRRWVKPYMKGSQGSLPNSHTYLLGVKENT
jgi:hypothetical protein